MTSSEFDFFMKALRPKEAKIFSNIDVNENGTVDIDEFLAMF